MKNKIVMPVRKKDELSGAGEGEKPFDYSAGNGDQLNLLVKSREARIAVPTFDGLQMVSINEIIKCIAHESYTEIVLQCGTKFMVCRTLKEYEDMLSPFNFFRIHNSSLVNLRHVKKYIRGEGGYLLMADGSSCEVARRKKHELVRRLSLIEF
jgi:two-component system LytT family response regulator